MIFIEPKKGKGGIYIMFSYIVWNTNMQNPYDWRKEFVKCVFLHLEFIYFLLYQEITGLSRVCRSKERWRDQRRGSTSLDWRSGATSMCPLTSLTTTWESDTDRERDTQGSVMYNIIYTPQQSCIWSWKPVLRGDFFHKGQFLQSRARGGKSAVASLYFFLEGEPFSR